MANKDNSGMIFFIIAIFVGVVLALYFLSKILLVLGMALVIISILSLIARFASQESRLVVFGLIILFIGIACVAIGQEGVSFFEENPTGVNLLDTSNSIVNATKEGVGVYSEIAQIENQAKLDVVNQTSIPD